ncbi:ribonuclease H-like domain-containing protein [Candidatus Woesearchaeota archaeon]|nr:ribonuclease H-like domain-containing protein [Candidatus Woesearchaeota archaeon]
MIRQSFIFLEKVGQKKENQIWKQGINCWDDFLRRNSIKGISKKTKICYDNNLRHAKKSLIEENSQWFAKYMPSAEHWRLYDYFRDENVFLDIERSSLYGSITIIGMFDGIETRTMVHGMNFDKKLLEKELSKYKLITTFNGSSFDLPVLKKYFGIKIKIPHIDLRHVCARINLKGGLKEIEKKIGIKRPCHLLPEGGEHANDLWKAFHASGDKEYLELLVKYNEEDVVNLKKIADFSIKELWGKILEN